MLISFCYKRLKLQTSHFLFKLYISNSISDFFFFPSWSECRLVEETSRLNTESMDSKDDACHPNKNTNAVLRKGWGRWGEGCGLSGNNFLQDEEWQSLGTKRYTGKDSGVRLCHTLLAWPWEQLLPECQILWRKRYPCLSELPSSGRKGAGGCCDCPFCLWVSLVPLTFSGYPSTSL